MRFNTSLNGAAGSSVFAFSFEGFFMFDPYGKGVGLSIGTIRSHPLTTHIGLIIAMWSMVEAHLSMLLSTILHTDAKVGATLFNSIRSESGRLAMIRAVSEERLTPTQQATYAAIKKRVDKVGGYRDEIAHNLWGRSSDDPDSLIWVDARIFARGYAGFKANPNQRPPKTPPKTPPKIVSLREYKEREFLFIQDEILALSEAIMAFTEELEKSTPAPRRTGRRPKS